MAKRKPRVSIRRKMAFSYVMLVLLVALISVGFMLVFLDGYVVSRERVSLERVTKQVGEMRYHNLSDPDGVDVDALTDIASDQNYSVVILTSDLKYVNSINLATERRRLPKKEEYAFLFAASVSATMFSVRIISCLQRRFRTLASEVTFSGFICFR